MIENAIRDLFWAISKLFLSIGDWIYDIIDMVININLSNSKVILYTWLFMLIFLTFACLFRIFFVLLRKTADDSESIDISKLLKKIGSVFLVVTISTTFFNFCLAAPGYIVRTYNKVITYDERMTSSTAVISATAKTPVTSSIDEMSSTDEVISIETIDEKLNEKENDEYIYFKGYAELLLCLVGSIIIAFLQIVLIVDTAMRLFLNIFRFVIGFIPISSLVEDNPTCGDWVRDIISDSLMMMFIPISLNMVYGLMSTSAFTLFNGIVRIILFAIGLMAISKTGDMVAKYMQASNLSKGSGMGLIFGGMMAIRGAGSVMRGAGKYLPKAAGGIGNLAKSGAEKASQLYNDTKNFHMAQAGMAAGALGNAVGGAMGGLGSNISSTTKKDDYFVNNASQGTFQGGASSTDVNESVLDQSPTSPANGTGTTTSVASGENGANTRSTGVTDASVKGDVKDKQAIFSGVNHSPVSPGGTAFVDNSTSGHLYKSSGSVYKQNLRDNYKAKSGGTKYNISDLEKSLLGQQKGGSDRT